MVSRGLAVVAANAQPPPVLRIVCVVAACDEFAPGEGPVVGHCGRGVAQSTVRFACQHSGPEPGLVPPPVPPLAGGGPGPVVPVGLAPGLSGWDECGTAGVTTG